jgi:hypothetical protein
LEATVPGILSSSNRKTVNPHDWFHLNNLANRGITYSNGLKNFHIIPGFLPL